MSPKSAGSRILVVDDEVLQIDVTLRFLRQAGFNRVRGVADPREALNVVREWEPDLIVLDLHMPRMDGDAFLREVRNRQSPTEFLPVLVVSGDPSRDALHRALEAGGNDYLTKPFDCAELQLRIRNLLCLRTCHEELRRHDSKLTAEFSARTGLDAQNALDRSQIETAVRAVIERGGPEMVFQPIVNLATGSTVGVEALARFGGSPRRTPDRWFADAASCGLGEELEISAVAAAIDQADALDPSWILAVNISAPTLLSGGFRRVMERARLDHVSLEITEHQPVDDYDALEHAMLEFRSAGALLTIDDAGAGYASLRHILKLKPDVIKLDITLTRDVDRDPAKRALASALQTFAVDIGAAITAEGIETASELVTLRELGIEFGQGFYLGRPDRRGARAVATPTLRRG